MTDSDRAALPCHWCQNMACGAAQLPSYDWRVNCHNQQCRAQGPVRSTEAEAIAAWNARTPGYAAGVEALAAQIDARLHDSASPKRTEIIAAVIRGALARAVPEEQVVERVAQAICRMCSGTRMKADDAWELCKSLGSDNEVRRFARDAIAALRGE